LGWAERRRLRLLDILPHEAVSAEGRRSGYKRRFTHLLAFGTVWLALFATACETFPARAKLAVAPASDGGRVLLYYIPCPGELIRSARIDQATGSSGKGEFTVLWKVSAPSGSRESQFSVGGSPPPGFVTVTALTQPLPTTSRLLGVVETSSFTVVIEFVIRDLRPGLVFTGHKESLPPTEFQSKALDVCSH
jgi:hypothetical protein